ncbi:MAG: ATP-grasp domain-containing protein [Microgenomates group bacterium]
MNVAIVYSLPSKRMMATPYGETDEDSRIIAEKVAIALAANKMNPRIYAIAEDRIDQILEIRADVIFNLIEWCGLDTHLSQKAFANFATLEIPITGSCEEVFVMTGDKAMMKGVLQKYGFPTPKGIFFETGDEKVEIELIYPVIVKPATEHCSTGLSYDSIAHDELELRTIAKHQIAKFHQPAIAEEFIQGRELLVYLLEDKDDVRVLPIEEVVFSNQNPLAFQTYESKWVTTHPDYQTSEVVVAQLSKGEQKTIEETSRAIFKKLGFGGYARFDVRLKDGVPYMLETNANPSVYDGDGSLSDPNEEVIPGIKFRDYILKIVEAARKGDKLYVNDSSI